MSISVLNTDAGLSGKTIVNAEDSQTVTGLKTFDRDPSAPFAVSSGSAAVANLDADKLDGQDGAYYGADWSTVAFSAGNFTANGGGTWTVASGDQNVYRIRKLTNKTLDVHITLDTTTISGTVSSVNITLPYTSLNTVAVPCLIFDNSSSVASFGWAQVAGGSATLIAKLGTGANLAASTDNTYFRIMITIETTT